jgi:hypothetical protein
MGKRLTFFFKHAGELLIIIFRRKEQIKKTKANTNKWKRSQSLHNTLTPTGFPTLAGSKLAAAAWRTPTAQADTPTLSRN